VSRAYDNDERPSWRDIDKKRERSSHTKEERGPKKDAPVDRWNIGRRKEALDRLFMGEKGTVEHEKLHNRVHKSYGAPGFLKAVQTYLEKYGPPDDISTLLLMLDCKDTDTIFLTMDKLKAIHATASAREKEDIRRKLSMMALTDKSLDVRERAEEIIEEIKSVPPQGSKT
jgi:hypothetical protein